MLEFPCYYFSQLVFIINKYCHHFIHSSRCIHYLRVKFQDFLKQVFSLKCRDNTNSHTFTRNRNIICFFLTIGRLNPFKSIRHKTLQNRLRGNLLCTGPTLSLVCHRLIQVIKTELRCVRNSYKR